MDDADNAASTSTTPVTRHVNRALSYLLLLGNAAALVGVLIFILWLTFDSLGLGPKLTGVASAIPHPSSLVVNAENSIVLVLAAGACLALAVAAIALIGITNRLTHHNYWSHEHFTGATLAQFFYVAAQCGIFSFLINYMTSEPPTLPASWIKEEQHMDRGPDGLCRRRLQGRAGIGQQTDFGRRSRIRIRGLQTL